MTPRRVPEGTPLSQAEWDCMSEPTRRWVLEALAILGNDFDSDRTRDAGTDGSKGNGPSESQERTSRSIGEDRGA
jgi:hypothetical protein